MTGNQADLDMITPPRTIQMFPQNPIVYVPLSWDDRIPRDGLLVQELRTRLGFPYEVGDFDFGNFRALAEQPHELTARLQNEMAGEITIYFYSKTPSKTRIPAIEAYLVSLLGGIKAQGNLQSTHHLFNRALKLGLGMQFDSRYTADSNEVYQIAYLETTHVNVSGNPWVVHLLLRHTVTGVIEHQAYNFYPANYWD